MTTKDSRFASLLSLSAAHPWVVFSGSSQKFLIALKSGFLISHDCSFLWGKCPHLRVVRDPAFSLQVAALPSFFRVWYQINFIDLSRDESLVFHIKSSCFRTICERPYSVPVRLLLSFPQGHPVTRCGSVPAPALFWWRLCPHECIWTGCTVTTGLMQGDGCRRVSPGNQCRLPHLHRCLGCSSLPAVAPHLGRSNSLRRAHDSCTLEESIPGQITVLLLVSSQTGSLLCGLQ